MTGLATLLRLALRRDRVSSTIWLAVLLVLMAGSANATLSLYPTLAERLTFAAGVRGSPTAVSLYGPGYDASTAGGAATYETLLLGAVLVWLLCCFVVIRHTRAEEAEGRAELVRAGAVGRFAAVAAALVAATLAALLAGVLTLLGLVATGVPLAGSATLALGFVAVGLAASSGGGGVRAADRERAGGQRVVRGGAGGGVRRPVGGRQRAQLGRLPLAAGLGRAVAAVRTDALVGLRAGRAVAAGARDSRSRTGGAPRPGRRAAGGPARVAAGGAGPARHPGPGLAPAAAGSARLGGRGSSSVGLRPAASRAR